MKKTFLILLLALSFWSGFQDAWGLYYDPRAVRKNSAGQLDNWLHYYRGIEQTQIKYWSQAESEFTYYFRHEDLHRHMFGIAYYGLGQMYEAMGRIDQAIDNYQLALREDKHPDVKITDKAYSAMGGINFKRGKFAEAVKLYQKAVEADAGNGLAHYYLGLSYLKLGKVAEADKECAEAKKLGVKYTALQEGLDKAKKAGKTAVKEKGE